MNLSLNLLSRERRRSWFVEVSPATLDLDAILIDQVIELQLDPESLKKALDEIGK